MKILRQKGFTEQIQQNEPTTSDKIDRVSKKVAKAGAITAGAGLGATIAGGALAAHGAKKFVATEGLKGAKRIASGTVMAGLGGQAAKWGTRGALAAGAVWAGNKLINGKPKNANPKN